MKIPITKPTFPEYSEIIEQFDECLTTGQVTNGGKYVRTFEQKLREYFNSKLPPVCFCNGEMALYNLIRAHKIKHNIPDGADVLVPSLTFSETVKPYDGVHEIIAALMSGKIRLDDPTCYTVNWYKSLIEWEKRIKDLSINGQIL